MEDRIRRRCLEDLKLRFEADWWAFGGGRASANETPTADNVLPLNLFLTTPLSTVDYRCIVEQSFSFNKQPCEMICLELSYACPNTNI